MDGGPRRQRTVPAAAMAPAAARGLDAIASARAPHARTALARARAWLVPVLLCLVAAAAMASPQAGPRLHSLGLDDGLPSDEVQALAQDPQGLLWIGTRAGLAVYDGRQVTPWSPGPGAAFPGLDVRRLESLPDGRLRIEWAEGSAGWLSADRLRFQRDDGARTSGPRPQPRLRDRRGTLWLGGPDGLRSRKPAGQWREGSGHPALAGEITALLEDHEGGLWIASRGHGLHRLAATAEAFRWLPAPVAPGCPWRPAGVVPAGAGNVWVASGDCLWRVDLDDGRATRERVAGAAPGEPLRGLAGDGADGAWLMLDEAVLHRPAGRREWRRWDVAGPRQLLPRAGGAWLLADHGRVQWLDASRPGRPLERPRVETSAQDSASAASFVASAEPGATTTAPPGVTRLWPGPDGAIWAEASGGLWRQDGRHWVPLAPVPGRPMAVSSDGATAWWLDATGLRAVGVKAGRLQSGPTRASAPPHEGAARLIARGPDAPWLLSLRGLSQPIGEAGWRRYGPRDGLPGRPADGAVAWLPARGTWGMATSEGLVEVDPGALQAAPPIDDRLHLSLQVVRGEAAVELASGPGLARMLAGDRDLRIQLRRIRFSEPGGDRFRAWFEGVDAGPVELGPAGLRLAPALAPGRHRLLFASARGAGPWSEPQEVTLLVDPPWWQTREFKLVLATAGLACLGLALAGLQVLLRRRAAWRLLEQRRRNAERVSGAKSRFLAMLAHEIRTPMTGVLGMAELLGHEDLAPAARARVEALQSAGRHLVRLVNDALDLARIESGRLSLEDADFDLQALLQEVAALLRPLAQARALGFALQQAPGLPRRVRGDATRLRQVLLNLGHNAVKFCDQGGLTLAAAPGDGGGVEFQVRDTGPGLSAGQRARLFRRFEAGAGSGGAGLGLAISQELAAAMGGPLRVESAPGEGAAFVLWLPLAPAAREAASAGPGDAAAPAAAADAATEAPRGAPTESFAGSAPSAAREGRPPPGDARRVLVVEDDPLVADVVCALLARAGHVARHAPHALAALSARATEPHDLLLLDLDLPGMDGLALSRLLAARGDGVPRVALTARVDAEAEPAARAAGMVGFLRKPVSGDALAAAVRRWAAVPD